MVDLRTHPGSGRPTSASGDGGSLARVVAKGLTWSLTGRAAGIVGSLLVQAMAARQLGQADFGAFAFGVSVGGFIALVLQLGLPSSSVRAMSSAVAARDPRRLGDVATTSLTIVAVSGLCLLLLTLTPVSEHISAAAPPILAPLLASVAGVGAARATAQVLTEHVRAFRDFRGTALGNGTTAQAFVAVCLSAGALGAWTPSTKVLLLALAVGYCLEAMLEAALRHSHMRGIPRGFTADRVFSPFIWISTILSFALTQQDLWLLGLVAPQEEVGLYAAAFRLVGIVLAPLIIVNLVVPPLISGMKTENRTQELQTLLRTTATVAAFPAVLALTALITAAPLWLDLVFGGDYDKAAEALVLLSLGQFVAVWTGSSAMTLLMTGHQRVLVGVNALALVGSLALEYVAYGMWGMAGVAAACSVVMALQNLSTWFLARRLTGLRTDVLLMSPLVALRACRRQLGRHRMKREDDRR